MENQSSPSSHFQNSTLGCKQFTPEEEAQRLRRENAVAEGVKEWMKNHPNSSHIKLKLSY
jgi:hypothetical protein